ncbi:MAG: Uma2 family endonuclease [Vicinamibacterales bacterium]
MQEDTGMERFAVSARRLTAREFLRIPEDGKRHELIDGVHYVTPSPNVRHQELVGRLHLSMGTFLESRPHLGRIFLPLDVVLSDHDVLEPDLLLVAADQQGILTKANLQGPPALAIEVLSPSTRMRDELVKRRLFDERGAREYWLVDPWDRRVTVFRRAADGSFPQVASLEASAGARLETPLLPGWSLPMEELFAER